MYEAPVSLIEPTRKLVQIALQRLQKGKTDDLGRKRIYLELKQKHRVFEVTDVRVDGWKLPEGSEKRNQELSGGLFVEQIELDEVGLPKKSPSGVQIPRLVELVTQGSICHLRTVPSETIAEMVEDLRNASLISKGRWDELIKKVPPDKYS